MLSDIKSGHKGLKVSKFITEEEERIQLKNQLKIKKRPNQSDHSSECSLDRFNTIKRRNAALSP